MDKQPKKQNNKAGRLLLMAVLAVIVIYAGARFTQSPQQPAAIAPAESAQPISGGLTLLTEPPAESAQPDESMAFNKGGTGVLCTYQRSECRTFAATRTLPCISVPG